MGSMQDPLTDLLGSHRIMNGDSIFDYAKFVSDIQEPCVILLDELSRAPLTANNILFPCLDSRRTLPIEIADSKNERTIKVHEKVTFIATANIGSEYSGTNEIDAALLNRFLPMQLDYLPEETEIKLIYKRTGVDIETIKKLMKFVTTVRTKYMSGELSKSVSTRETIQCGLLIADGFQLIDAIEFVVANKFINNNYNNEYSDIKKIIMGF
jgi:MoxR-like ATPase